ncbi:hypothetical protein [Salibacterium salarium]|nr:hypothetical protein [Salibacterium salarium]
MTEEEFAALKEDFDRRANEHARNRMHAKRYSGPIKCGACGYARSFVTKTNAKGEEVVTVKPCQKADAYGNKCGNGGGKETYVDAAVYAQLVEYKQELEQDLEGNNGSDAEQLEQELHQAEQKLDKAKKALSRVMEMYEEGDYTKAEFQERRDQRKEQISSLENNIEELKQRINYHEQVTNEERLEKVGEVLEVWDGEASKVNKLLRLVIDRINFKRDEDGKLIIQVVYS